METITTELIVDGTKVPIYEEPRRTRFGINEILEIFSANRPSTMGRYCAVALADCWRLLEDLLDRYAGLSEQRRAALEVPLRWFAKGNSEFQSTDKFISHWIAFNSLYADPGVKEPDAISNYVRNRIAPSVAMRLVTGNQKTLQDLSRHPVTLGRQKARAIAQELSKALSTDHQHPLQVLESALLTIYAVRNGLFHGDHPPSATGTAWERVWLAESALAAIVRAILLSEVSSAVDADARTVKQESVAI